MYGTLTTKFQSLISKDTERLSKPKLGCVTRVSPTAFPKLKHDPGFFPSNLGLEHNSCDLRRLMPFSSRPFIVLSAMTHETRIFADKAWAFVAPGCVVLNQVTGAFVDIDVILAV